MMGTAAQTGSNGYAPDADHYSAVRLGGLLTTERWGVAAVQQSRATREVPAPSYADDLLTTAAEAELARALMTDDEHRAALAADTLWRSTGSLPAVHRVISEQLTAAGAGWAAGFTSLAVAQRLTVASTRLIERMRPLPPTGSRGTVVLACPPEDSHTLALHAVAHLVEDQGHRAVVGGSLPWEDLAELAAEEDQLEALCLSLHTEVGVATVRRGIAVVRKACGPVPVLIGGPRVAADPSLVRRLGADAGSHDAEEALQHLSVWTSRLTDREREVLECISTGMTNAEVAVALGLGQATIKSHLDRIFLKTGTTQRAAAVATALRHGWFS